MKYLIWALSLFLISGCNVQSAKNETTIIEQKSSNKIVAIEAGGYVSTILKSDGSVWTSGRNNVGQLGNGTKKNSAELKQVSVINGVVSISGKTDHTLAITKDGSVWGWGYNSKNEITEGEKSIINPIQIDGITDIIQVSTGGYHSLALDRSGNVWAWGDNLYGQLGNGTYDSHSRPVRVSPLSNIVAIDAGGEYSLALTKDGKVWSWGRNEFYQLGNGDNAKSNLPVLVNKLNNVKSISAGDNHALALTQNGEVWAWGYNSNGQIGDGSSNVYQKDGSLEDNKDKAEPVKISGFRGKVKSVSAGYKHSIALTENGEVYGWGWNEYGQLGNGTVVDSKIPLLNDKLSAKIIKIDTGFYHSFAIDEKETVYSWGDDLYGQLADGITNKIKKMPTVLEIK